MIALIKAGVIEADFGSLPSVTVDRNSGRFIVATTAFRDKKKIVADALVVARVHKNGPAVDTSPLMRSLLKRNLVRPFCNDGFFAGGIDISKELKVIDASGKPQENMMAIGPITEGVRFYTFLLAMVNTKTDMIEDAGKCIMRVLQIDIDQEIQKAA